MPKNLDLNDLENVSGGASGDDELYKATLLPYVGTIAGKLNVLPQTFTSVAEAKATAQTEANKMFVNSNYTAINYTISGLKTGGRSRIVETGTFNK